MLYARVEITDLNNITRIVGSENRGFELRLHDDSASTFRLIVNDQTGFYREAYGIGSIVNVFCDSVNPPRQHVYQGQVEDVSVRFEGGRRLLVIDAVEYAYTVILNRYVVETYQDKSIEYIVRDLFAKYAPEVDTHNVQPTNMSSGSLVFNYVTLKECLDQLAELAHCQYIFSPDLELYFYPKGSARSGFTLTSDNILQPIEVQESIRGVRNVVYVIGGYELRVDQSQTAIGGYVTLNEYHYAGKFTPTYNNLRMLALYLEKKGEPTENISGQIVEDLDGAPRGRMVDCFTITPRDVGEEGSAGWVSLPLQADVDPGKPYWITLSKSGTEVDTYRWYHDASNQGIHAYSPDGENWVVVDSSWSPTFKQFCGVPVLAQAVNESSIKKYGRREMVYVNTSIIDRSTVKALALNLLAAAVEKKLSIESLVVRGLHRLPQVGECVRVVLPEIGLDKEFKIKSVVAEFGAGAPSLEDLMLELEDLA